MEAKSYRIVLLGIDSGKDPQAVRQQLALTFRTSPEQIEQLLSKLPVTVKSRADYQTAKKYHDAIQNAGCTCRMEAEEDMRHAAPPSPESSPAVKTCPNCGYKATAPDDPLLTAHDGHGECPACGIIVSKFTRIRESLNAEPPPVQEENEKSSTLEKGIISSVLSRPWISLLVLAVAVVSVYNLFFRESPPEKGLDAKQKSTATNAGQGSAQVKTAPAGGEVYKVLPGETRDVVLTTYLDLLHRDSFSPLTITPVHKLENNWEQEGVRVDVRNVKVTPVSVSLWEQQRVNDDVWVPLGYGKISSQGGSSGMVEKGKNLLVTPTPAALVKKPDETSVKVDPANPKFRKNAYTLYRVEYELSVSVPSGQEFGVRQSVVTNQEGKAVPQFGKMKNVCISTFVQWDNNSAAEALMPPGAGTGSGQWKAGKVAVFGTKKNCISMDHVIDKEGLYLSPGDKFAESSAYCELEMP